MGDSPAFLEFFSGIGGLAFAAQAVQTRVLRSFDQDQAANRIHTLFHGRTPSSRNLATIKVDALGEPGTAGWLLSPPCQPYTTMGKQQDTDDPRTLPLMNLITILPRNRPSSLLLENVPPFMHSRSRLRLLDALQSAGLEWMEIVLCPTQLGIPNRRSRYYLLAAKSPLGPPPELPKFHSTLADYLDKHPSPSLALPQDTVERLTPNVDLVRPDGIAGCFGSSYGRALHGAGGYLIQAREQADGDTPDRELTVRRFSPSEVLRFHHFPQDARFPEDLPVRDGYRLAGNSINVAVATYLLKWLTGIRLP